jgi:superfamily II DNA or RNA helicase
LGLWLAAPNAGKTFVIGAMAQAFTYFPVCYICHTQLLANQTFAHLSRIFDEQIGFVGASRLDERRVTVYMIQTVLQKFQGRYPLRIFRKPSVILYDECHHVTAAKWRAVLRSIPYACLYGFTATSPEDALGKMRFKATFGDPTLITEHKELVEGDYSASIRVVFLERPAQQQGGRWNYLRSIVLNSDRNELIVRLVSQLQHCLVLCNHVKHAKILYASLVQFGVNAGIVHANLGLRHNRQCLLDLNEGVLQAVVSSPVVDEGISIDEIWNVVLAGGLKSPIKLIQRIGRGIRKKASGREVIVWDFCDSENKYVRKHSRLRQRTCEDAFPGCVSVQSVFSTLNLWQERQNGKSEGIVADSDTST